MALLALAGCTHGNLPPELLSIAPSEVDARADSEVAISGANLFDAPHVDLTTAGRAQLRRDWRVLLGDSGLALTQVERPDGQTLRGVVPAGTPAGVYDVIAISPLGAAARLPAALTVTAGAAGRRALRIRLAPAADGGGGDASASDASVDAGGERVLSIEGAAAGLGVRLDQLQATTDQTASLFAIWRDPAGRFVADAAVTWSVSKALAHPPAAPTAHWVAAFDQIGEGSIVVRDADGREAQLALMVKAGSAHTIAIQPDHVDLSVGAAAIQFAVTAQDAAGNDTDDFGTLSWSIADGSIGALDPKSGLFAPQQIGAGHIAVTSSFGARATSGLVRVQVGALATLTLQPQTAVLSADAAPLTFSAIGVDAFGNPTSDLGTLHWTIDSGAIANLSSDGVLDPSVAGTGRVRVTSSLGPSTVSGDVQITPGRARSLSVSPNNLSTMVGEAPIPFSAIGRDADGNRTSDVGVLTFSIASGSIGFIAADSGMFTPQTAGDGTIGVATSYGFAASSGAIHVDPFSSQVRVSALRLPDAVWPNEDSVRVELDVENDGTRDVVLTGAYFAISVAGADVTSQYTITSDYN
ncbi:MAG TPA: hypothetical protein VGI70_17220, partial [Polyangiales bacterium]